jgi:hypothetical protein
VYHELHASNLPTGSRRNEAVAFDVTDGLWVLLKDAVLRFADSETTEAMQIRFEEATRTFSVYNPNSGKFGDAYPAGPAVDLQTNTARCCSHRRRSGARARPDPA